MCYLPGPPPPPPTAPQEAQAPWWSPRIRRNFWAWTMTLDFQPCVGSRDRGLTDQVAKPMPPRLYSLVLRFQSDTWIWRAQEEKMALKTLPTHRTGQDPLGSLTSSGQPHAPSPGGARPGCPRPLEGAPSSVPGPDSWCHPEADTEKEGARLESGVRGQTLPVSRPETQQGTVGDPC